MLNGIQIIPYAIELRQTLDAALFHFETLRVACEKALAAQDRARNQLRLDAEAFAEQTAAQLQVFDHLEAFLGSFSRVSLLVFPVSQSRQAIQRAATLQHCLEVDGTSALANRAARDSWIHHDERLDFAVVSNTGDSSLIFSRSSESPREKLATFLRVIELDTMTLHFRDRNGSAQSLPLHSLYEALLELERKRPHAFLKLSIPAEESNGEA